MALAALHRPPPLDAVEVVNPDGGGGIVLVCEHASHAIPEEFGDLGLSPEARFSHIAWDPGAMAVAAALAARLDAPVVAGGISRLVYDVNRPPEAPSAIPETSEVFDIPGNRTLSAAGREDRIARVYHPFHARLAAVLDARPGAAVVTVHSFTPVFFGVRRPWDVGIIHDAEPALATALLAALGSAGSVALNVPYSAADGVTHTLARHAAPRGLLNAMVEIRNDLVADAAGVALWAGRLGDALAAALPVAAGSPLVSARPMPRWATAYVRSVESVAWLVGRATMFLIFVMIAVLVWSSVSKYYRIPAIWTLEVSQFLMVGYFLLGGAYAMQLGDHVRMDLAYAFWSPRRKAIVDSVTIFFLLFYLGVLLYGGLSSTTYAISVGERNFSAWRPLMWPIKVVMVVGIALILLQTIATFLRDLATALGRDIGVPRTEGHDPDVPGEAEAMSERRA